MADEIQKTGVERYDRYRAAVREQILVSDEVGEPASHRAGGIRLKIDLLRAREALLVAEHSGIGDLAALRDAVARAKLALNEAEIERRTAA